MKSIERQQEEHLGNINLWIVVNTIFTIITGLATLYLSVKK